MKLSVVSTVWVLFTCQCTIAQNFGNLNFIDYEVKLRDIADRKVIANHVKIWFNSDVSYNQAWDMPMELLTKQGNHFNHKDSIDNYDIMESYIKGYFEEKRFTYCIYANKDSNTCMVDYVVKNGIPYYFKQKPYKNKFNDIVFINDTLRTILGKPCKLAIGNFKYDDTLLTVQLKIWYAADIKTSICPNLFIKNIPGLVMAIEGKNEEFIAVNLEQPSRTIGKFNFNIAPEIFHTRKEYDLVYSVFINQF